MNTTNCTLPKLKSICFAAILWLSMPLTAQTTELLNYPLDTIDGEMVYRYEVEKSIGLYRIGLNFNVTQSEIIRLNPQLRERGLHFGETLLIPTGLHAEKTVKPTQVETKAETPKDTVEFLGAKFVVPAKTEPVDTTTVLANTVTPRIAQGKQVIELALMLPFESQQSKRSQNAERMSEFYQGALLALQNNQNDSVLYRLRVYDSERSDRRVAALCDSTELDSVQAILGLVYPIQIERMAAWCNEKKVPLFVPFSDEIDLAKDSLVLQFNANDNQEADSLCEWMLKQDSIHCVVLDVRESDISTSVRNLRKQMKAHEITYSALALHDLMIDSAAYAFDAGKENLVVLHSDKYQQARILLPHLEALMAVGYQIRLVGQYSWIKESVSLPMVYVSMFNTDADTEAYDAQWNKYFDPQHVSETPRYDLLGYDLMKSVIEFLRGKNTTEGIQSYIQWQRIGETGGWQNTGMRVVAN